MRPLLPWLAGLLMLASLLTSCGTLESLSRFPEPPQIYGGARADWQTIRYMPGSRSFSLVFIGYLFWIPELALSAILDTVFLPATIPADIFSGPSVAELAEQLRERDPARRAAACRELAARGENAAQAVPALIEVLALDPDRGVRPLAAFALGEIGPQARDALPALRAALRDENESTRSQARLAIQKLGGAPAR